MNRYIKMVFVTSVVLFALLYTKAVAAGGRHKYVVPARSNKYHVPTCRYAQKPGSGELATFLSAKDALAAGHTPCKVCKPPDQD